MVHQTLVTVYYCYFIIWKVDGAVCDHTSSYCYKLFGLSLLCRNMCIMVVGKRPVLCGLITPNANVRVPSLMYMFSLLLFYCDDFVV
jgi:hypothetical protein